MSAWLWPWWIVANAALGHVTYGLIRKLSKARRRRSHEALMMRIVRLELDLGLGLFYAQDWLREREPIQMCWGCGTSLDYSMRLMYYDRYTLKGKRRYDAELEARLCPSCIAKVDRELAAL